ncbi:MAG: hypothetical protein F4Y03_07010 [Alphaproteobacteria bacterium]|nr:hypothetical protein [Alphaproteobacteria bacterium]
MRAALSFTLLLLVIGGVVSDGRAGQEPPYSSDEKSPTPTLEDKLKQARDERDEDELRRLAIKIAQARLERLEQQAAEWDAFKGRVEKELLPLPHGGLADKDDFDLEPRKSWKWWDDRHTNAGKALRARLVRWLRASPMMEGASDPNLWFMVHFYEGVARMNAKIEDLEAKSPNNAPVASGFGPGSSFERFELWTGCKPLYPALSLHPEDDAFEDSVRAAVESRLRGARLYRDLTDSGGWLRIAVNRGNGLFSISVGLQKLLFDPITGLRSMAYPDHQGGDYGSFGSGPPEYVRSVLADQLDKFLADYLRVNEAACGDRPVVSN